MCHFVSWIEGRDDQGDKKVFFLTDLDVNQYRRENPYRNSSDMLGHDAIRWVMPEAPQTGEREGYTRIPPIIARAIRAGKMNGQMTIGGFKELHYNVKGQLHSRKGAAVIDTYDQETFFLNGRIYASRKAWLAAKKRGR